MDVLSVLRLQPIVFRALVDGLPQCDFTATKTRLGSLDESIKMLYQTDG